MTVKLTSNFLANARGITFVDGGGITWTINKNTNEISASGGGGATTRGATFTAGLVAIITPANDVPIDIPSNCTITKAVILTQGGPGSCVFDVWKAPFGSYPPTVANSIVGASPPTIVSGVKYSDSTLTGWTTGLSAGDTLLIHLASCSNFTTASLFLEMAA